MDFIEGLHNQFDEALQTVDKSQVKARLDAIETLVTKRMLENSLEPDERQALIDFMSRLNDARVRELGYPEWRHLLNGTNGA